MNALVQTTFSRSSAAVSCLNPSYQHRRVIFVMKLLAIALISLAFCALLPLTLGEVDRYKVNIEEKGTRFTEEIEIDEQKNFEVYRVPAHNEVDGADFYHDFKMRVTVTRILSRKVCHISEMDSTLSSPEKLKKDLERAASQPGKLPVTRKSHLVKVTGPANRLLLSKEILEFCGALPIYNTKIWEYSDYDPSNDTAIIQMRRQRRQTGDVTVETFISCLRLEKLNSMTHVEDCMKADHWNLKCRMTRGDCYYEVTCEKLETRYDWTCREVHLQYSNPACCDYICP